MKRLFFLLMLLCSSARADYSLRILTLNAWTPRDPILGIALAKDIEDRLKILPTLVRQVKADIVIFQEVWRDEVREQVINGLTFAGFAYSAYHEMHGSGLGGIMGNGLLIMSKFRLDPNVLAMKFSAHTNPMEVFTAKGAIKTRVDLPGLGWVDLYDAHLGAVDFDVKAQTYDPTQNAKKYLQAKELVQWMEDTQQSKTKIFAADLNTDLYAYEAPQFDFQRFSDVYQLLTNKPSEQGLGLLDSFRQVNGFSVPAYTYDTRDNPYASDGDYASLPPEVEDYVFLDPNPRLVPVASNLVFQDPIPESYKDEFDLEKLPLRLSDHYGVLSTLRVIE